MSQKYQTYEERSNAWKRVGVVPFSDWPVIQDTNNASGDAFGRLRVSEPYTDIGLKQLYDSNPLFYDISGVDASVIGYTVSGAGTAAANGVYSDLGEVANGKPIYNGPNGYFLQYDTDKWQLLITIDGSDDLIYTQLVTSVTPDAEAFVVAGGDAPAPSVALTGVGTTTFAHNPDEASTTISTNGVLGKIVMQSKIRGTYQPGKSFLFLCTFSNLESQANIIKRAGYFDDNNGLFVEHSDGTAKFVRRTSTSGSPVDNQVAQADWNIDPFDGTGPSELTIDFTKTQILVIDFEWLGVGRVRFGWDINGVIYYAHEMLNANNLDTVYMANPNLPVRYSVEDTGAASADSLDAICATIIAEGGGEEDAITTYVSRGGTSITLANEGLYTPIISIRLNPSKTSTRVKIRDTNVFCTTNTNYEWKLFLNPPIAGTDAASWQSVNNSSVQYDISRDNTNTISAGYVMGGGYGSSTAQSRTSLSADIRTDLTLGENIDGTTDEIVLAVANIDGNGGTAYGGIKVGEYT